MKRVFAVFASVLFIVSLLALTPQKIYFQAVIRDASNNIVVSHSVGMQISILQGSVDGTPIYLEVQTPTTDLNGIVSIEIGGGPDFNAINWSTGSYFIKTETDPTGGTNYTLTGTSQLISVPYALHSHTADSLTGVISETDPIFIVSPAFAITTSNIDNWNAAYSWGNHAGLYSLLGHTHPYLPLIGGEMSNTNLVTNLNTDLLDGQHGSFYAPAKGSDNYISNQDSSAQSASFKISGNGSFGGKVYVNGIQTIFVPNLTDFDGSLVIGDGGSFLSKSPPFSPSGFNTHIAKQNTFVGIGAGFSNTTGNQNTFVGKAAGYSNTVGDQSTFIGMYAGQLNTTGWFNTFVGAWAGYQNTTGNLNAFMGTDCGNYNTTGSENSFFGNAAGGFNTTGNQNAFFGRTAGYSNSADGNSFFGRSAGTTTTTGGNNSFFGLNAGYNNLTGESNCFFGYYASIFNTTGSHNSFFGERSGMYVTSGSSNIGIGSYSASSLKKGNYNTFLGTGAGSNELQKSDAINSMALGYGAYTTADNQVVIGNDSITQTLLRGNVGIGTTIPTELLHVVGSGSAKALKVETTSRHAAFIELSSNSGELITRLQSNSKTGFVGTMTNNRFDIYSNGIERISADTTGNVGIGYSSGSEITNNKLAVNGNIYANGTITAIGGNSTAWNTAYSWGNHAGLYRPISYVPSWSEISSNPFSITSAVNDQLLKYNSTTGKWENWTPNFLTVFTETDPTFTAWDKTSGISITASQVNDFQTSVTNNVAVLANTAKNSYPDSDKTKLAGIEAGAQKNVNADWNATSGDGKILNKPNITVGNNLGDMQYWNGTAWVLVPAGQPGQFLQFTASSTPQWTTVLPILTTATVSSATANSVISGGNIISSGGGTITERGVCWSTLPDPTISDSKTTNGTGTGTFASLLTGLTAGTTYYIRAYATNSSFTAYGNEVRF